MTMNYDNIHVLESQKFKTVTLVAKFRAALDRETVTKRALIPFLLQQGTARFPSEKQLNKKLNELYGASLSITTVKKGNHHIISFHMEVANEKYIQNERTILEETLQLLHDIIYQPRVEGHAFPQAVFDREKATLQNKIKSIVDDKIVYANQRLIDEMCADETYSVHTSGYVEDLEGLTTKDVYAYYQEVLRHDKRDIYVIGDINKAEVTEKINAIFPEQQAEETSQLTVEKGNKTAEVRTVIETQAIQQAKLHIGFRTNVTNQDEDYYALQIFNGLFGGFPSSKLFVNVREKHSLAYYVGSRLESHKGLLIVLSGIAAGDYEKAKEIIEAEFAAMLAGDFTEENVAAIKDLVISQILETEDSARGAIEMLYDQAVANKHESLDEYRDKIAQVSKDDVVKVAQKIALDTIYLLTSEGDEVE